MQANRKKNFNILKAFFLFACFIYISSFISCESTKNQNINSDAIYIEYLNIADIYYSQEKYDKAITYYNLAMANKDIYWKALFKLAKTYAINNSWSEAENAYIQLLERDVDNSTLKSSLAYIYAMNNKVELSENLYQQLFNDFPEVKDYLENLISIELLLGNYNKASLLLDELIEKFPASEKIKAYQSELEKNIQQNENDNSKEMNISTESENIQEKSEKKNNSNEKGNNSKNPEESNLDFDSIMDE